MSLVWLLWWIWFGSWKFLEGKFELGEYLKGVNFFFSLNMYDFLVMCEIIGMLKRVFGVCLGFFGIYSVFF